MTGTSDKQARTCSWAIARSALVPVLNSIKATDCPPRSVRRRLLMYPCTEREKMPGDDAVRYRDEGLRSEQDEGVPHRHFHAERLERTNLKIRRQLGNKQRGRWVVRAGSLCPARVVAPPLDARRARARWRAGGARAPPLLRRASSLKPSPSVAFFVV